MATCEKCGSKGHEPRKMFIEMESKSFVGECCLDKCSLYIPVDPSKHPMPHELFVLPESSDDIEYGVELSNKIGVRAFVAYGGLNLAFNRTPQQIRTWAEKNGLTLSP